MEERIITKYPNLKKIIEEMGLDNGQRDLFFKHFELALNGKSESQTVYDVNRLESIAGIAANMKVLNVISENELIQALDLQPDEDVEDYNVELPEQFGGGAGEINDVIRTKSDYWVYMLDFLTDVFQATPEY